MLYNTEITNKAFLFITVTTCSIDEFRCLEGMCISIDKRCNGYPDCRNGDDEESCGKYLF